MRHSPILTAAVAQLRPPSPWLAFATVLFAHGLFILATGVRHGGDTLAYSLAADRLLDSGFDLPREVRENGTTYPPALYVLFASLVVGLKMMFGDGWEIAIVVINLIAEAAVGALLVRTLYRASGSVPAVWAGLALFLACFDLVQWTPYVLSDTSFLLMAFATFALAADRILAGRGSWFPVFALATAAAFYRPTGVVLILAAIWAYYLARTRVGRGRSRASLSAGVALVTVVGTLLFAWVMQDPARWPLEILSGVIDETASRYALGEVVMARPETYRALPVSVADHAAISADRFLHFFAISARDFSWAHIGLALLFFVPVYALMVVLAVALVTRKDGLTGPQRDVFFAAAAFVVATAVFHALLQVDFDWRYRLPILPHLILLAGGGVAVLSRRTAGR